MEYVIQCGLFVLGAAMGSFAAASVWRIRAAELRRNPKLASTPLEKRLAKQPAVGARKDRSHCLHCGYQLCWYDLIPVISWLALRGRCRRCRKPIGWMEFLAEVSVGLAFTASYTLLTPNLPVVWLAVVSLLWLAAIVLLAMQWMYDAKWYVLVTSFTVALGIIALIIKLILIITGQVTITAVLFHAGIAAVLMPGLYGLLCFVSKGRWVGLGDVYLLVPFALFVSSWQQAFLVVFLANVFGCVVIIPGLMRGRITRRSRVPFGPFLIAAFMVAMLVGPQLISWYQQMLFGTL